MRKYVFLLMAAVPPMLSAEAWRPSDFEIRGWSMAVAATDTCSNVFSPIGFAVSAAMLGEAAGDSQRMAIAEALGGINDFADTFSYVLESYAATSASNAVAISMAPSIWSRRIRSMDIGYRHRMMRTFGAVSGRLADPVPVNAWTEAKTDGRIPSVIQGIPADGDIMLLNAVAFEGAWKDGFDKKFTRTDDFRTDGGRIAPVLFMHGETTVTRIQNGEFTAISLPFAAEGVYALYMLPPPGMPIGNLRSEIGTRISIDEVKSLFRVGKGVDVDVVRLKIALPKMELRSSWNLLPLMSRLKFPTGGYAHLGEKWKIGGVFQSACIKVAETGYSLTPGAKPPKLKKKDTSWRHVRDGEEDEADLPPVAKEELVFNRPFVFLVWDSNTDTIILAGQFTGM